MKKFTWQKFYKSLAEKIIQKYDQNPKDTEKYLRGIMAE